ncbi:hypothetical protein L6164_000637 [Bauhinia variegata]|uniref:Uncharacterized protein n=1 Tax=Bauhinia variegata TaxID=167791 RepID=A0ACB9Q7D1_BAUVA|nr:hypothetical protein L6164_000637 [Bauhinia variegata]
MRLTPMTTLKPCPTFSTVTNNKVIKPQCITTVLQPTTKPDNLSMSEEDTRQAAKRLEKLIDKDTDHYNLSSISPIRKDKLRKRWMEYQGLSNWEGMLDPLDDNLRAEILRYGNFVEATYKSFEFDPSSPFYATCRFSKNSLFDRCGLLNSGYKVTKHLSATSGIQLSSRVEMALSWAATRSSYIGYVAVCKDKEEIKRLGRRDVVVAFRGTTTCLEWLENFRATLTHLPCSTNFDMVKNGDGAMVQSGFLSLYTSGAGASSKSLQQMLRDEIARILQTYGDELPISLTITGHSLGAALATLAAYDINNHFNPALMVTVISFGSPRVGNWSFRQHLEKQGTRVLRIVNSDDVITKVPGFVFDDVVGKGDVHVAGLPNWIQKREEDAHRWTYAEVGKELRLCSRDSPYLTSINVATSHHLNTYLHLVDGFVSSSCPFRATARRFLRR